MEAIRVTDKEWEIAGVHYVRTEAMCNGFGVSLEMEFGEDKAGDEYILVLDGIHPVSTCRLHQLDENTGKIERVATLKEYRGQHYGAAAITAAEIEDGTTDLAIIDVAMYNAYQKEYNYDVVANQISDEDAKAIADNSYAYYIFPKDQEELRDKVDEQLKELKKDGTLTELSQKYFGQDTAPEDDQFEKTPN